MMGKKAYSDGEIEHDFDLPDDYDDDILEAVHTALKMNGIIVDDLTFGEDDDTLAIYGNAIYVPDRDRECQTGDPWIDSIVDQIRQEVQDRDTREPK
jgi:hypothetical protein